MGNSSVHEPVLKASHKHDDYNPLADIFKAVFSSLLSLNLPVYQVEKPGLALYVYLCMIQSS